MRPTPLVMLLYLATVAFLAFGTDIDAATLGAVAILPMASVAALSRNQRCCGLCRMLRRRAVQTH